MIDGFGDAGGITYTISLYDRASDTAKKIVTTTGIFGGGEMYATIDVMGRIWIAEFTPGGDEMTDGNNRLIRLYALDKTGKEVAQYLPADIPLHDIEALRFALSGMVALANDTQQIVFNPSTGSFGSAERLIEYDKLYTDGIDLVKEKLRVPESYDLKFTPATE